MHRVSTFFSTIMRYLWQHVEGILAAYDGSLPLHHFLKAYFKLHPKLGSRDRKGLSDAVYAWYRAGKSLAATDADTERLRLAAMYLCGIRPKAFAAFFPAHWTDQLSVKVRMVLLRQDGLLVHPEQLFPDAHPLSEGISAEAWRMSMLHQPRLFLRIRKDFDLVRGAVLKTGLPNEWLSDTCLAVPNGTRVEDLLPADCYVVQDASSQATGRYLLPRLREQWWDCCSGAGGKSLMLKDAEPEVSLLATDVRQSILSNLKERFRLYGHRLPEMMTLDAGNASATSMLLGDRRFDGIICDVPCTGSGTWARTPESCYFFRPSAIGEYAARQTAILRNAGNYLRPEGRIIYITCSVFRAENEDVIRSVSAEGRLKIVSAGLINGLDKGADALFAAELRPA